MKLQTKNVGILGIGNLLLSDESFGIHVVKHLEAHYRFPDSVTIMDGGTAGIYMAPFLETHDPIFIVDVVNLDDEFLRKYTHPNVSPSTGNSGNTRYL